MLVFTPVVAAFRFYASGTESGSSPLAAQDTNITKNAFPFSELIHLRYRVDETGGAAGQTTDDYQLQYSKNSGAFTNVTGSSLVAHATNDGSLTDGAATTNRATNGITDGAGSFVAGEVEDVNGVIEDRQLTASNFTEHLFCFRLKGADLAAGDTVDFRISLNGGAPGITNNVTPRITVDNYEPQLNAFRFYEDGTESGSTPIAAQDTNINRLVDSDSIVHLRMRFDELGGVGADAGGDGWQLQYSKNSGAYANVESGSTNVRDAPSSALSGGSATTNRATNGITDPGAGSFVAGVQCEANGIINSYSLTANNFTEQVYAITLKSADLADGDTLDFRVTAATIPIPSGITPRITVSKTVPPPAPVLEDGSYQDDVLDPELDQTYLTAIEGPVGEDFTEPPLPVLVDGDYPFEATLEDDLVFATEGVRDPVGDNEPELPTNAELDVIDYEDPQPTDISAISSQLPSDGIGWSVAESSVDITISQENRNATRNITGSQAYRNAYAEISHVRGKYYFEAVSTIIGSAPGEHAAIGLSEDGRSVTQYLGSSAAVFKSWGFYATGSMWFNNNEFAQGNGINNYDPGEVVAMAVDLNAGRIWFRDATGWVDGDPATDTDPSFTFAPGPAWRAGTTLYDGVAPDTANSIGNFGQAAFIYPQPAGFAVWNSADPPAVDATIATGEAELFEAEEALEYHTASINEALPEEGAAVEEPIAGEPAAPELEEEDLEYHTASIAGALEEVFEESLPSFEDQDLERFTESEIEIDYTVASGSVDDIVPSTELAPSTFDDFWIWADEDPPFILGLDADPLPEDFTPPVIPTTAPGLVIGGVVVAGVATLAQEARIQ